MFLAMKVPTQAAKSSTAPEFLSKLTMKSSVSFLSILALSPLATAQIPDCATSCILDAAASAAPTCGSNVLCQCQPSTFSAIVNASTPCVIEACPDPIGSSTTHIVSASLVESLPAVLNGADETCSYVIAAASSLFSASASLPSSAPSTWSYSTAAASSSAAAETTGAGPAAPTYPPIVASSTDSTTLAAAPSSTALTSPLQPSSSQSNNGTATSTLPFLPAAGAGAKFALGKAVTCLLF